MCWSNSPPDFLCGEEVAVSPDHLHCAAALEMFVPVRQVWAEPGFHENLSLDLNLQAGCTDGELGRHLLAAESGSCRVGSSEPVKACLG